MRISTLAVVGILMVLVFAPLATVRTSTAGTSESGMVTVSVSVARSIQVNPDGTCEANVPVVVQENEGHVTYVEP